MGSKNTRHAADKALEKRGLLGYKMFPKSQKLTRKAMAQKLTPESSEVKHQAGQRLGKSKTDSLSSVFLSPKQEKKQQRGGSKNEPWFSMASLLCSTIQKIDGFRYERRIRSWMNQFRLLHEEDGIPSSDIWQVLKWYCNQRKAGTDSKLPKCVTANMFRGTFGWIREKWLAAGECAVAPNAMWVRAAKATFNEVEFHQTPLTVAMLAGLYDCLDQWYRKIMVSLRASRDPSAERLYSVLDVAPDGESFPEQVGRHLWIRVSKWPDWNGDLSPYRPGGHEFISFLQGRSRDIFGAMLSPKDLALLLWRPECDD